VPLLLGWQRSLRQQRGEAAASAARLRLKRRPAAARRIASRMAGWAGAVPVHGPDTMASVKVDV